MNITETADLVKDIYIQVKHEPHSINVLLVADPDEYISFGGLFRTIAGPGHNTHMEPNNGAILHIIDCSRANIDYITCGMSVDKYWSTFQPIPEHIMCSIRACIHPKE
jgi:hypothetical protein